MKSRRPKNDDEPAVSSQAAIAGGEPPESGNKKQTNTKPAKVLVATRMDPKDIARIKALADQFSIPGRKCTRSEMVRLLIKHGVEKYEARVKRGAKNKRRE